MKIFYALIFCVCTISAFAQNNIVKDVKQETNGNYWFRSATINVRNYETKAEVLTHTFNDTTSLKGINKLPFPIHPIFLSVYIQSGKLAACTLWNNLAEYNVINEGMLLLPAKESEKEIDPKPEDNFSKEELILRLVFLELSCAISDDIFVFILIIFFLVIYNDILLK